MPKEQVPLQQISDYLPENTAADVIYYLTTYKVQLTITRKRKSVLGDYRHSIADKQHRISVNGNLNPYSFLITLLHELAHLFTFDQYGNKVMPHGKEWKQSFGGLLERFLFKKTFPSDIESALRNSIASPAASTCGDPELMRVLRKYDPHQEGIHTVEQLSEGTQFTISDGRIFSRGPKIRTRFKCTEISSGKLYLFNGLYEVRV